MREYEELKDLLKNTLLQEASNELMKDVLKRRRKAAKKRADIEKAIIVDAAYVLLPEPDECESHITAQFDVTPDKTH